MLKFVTGAVVGSTVMYLLDPDRGRSRRARYRDQLRSRARRMRRARQRQAELEEGRAYGKRLKEQGLGHFHRTDPVSVAQHVEQLLARLDVDTHDVTVEVAGDTVRLRGQVGSHDDIAKVVDAVRRSEGVDRVESWLHLPGEPAPNKAAARAASERAVS